MRGANASYAFSCRNHLGQTTSGGSGDTCRGASSILPATCVVVGLNLANNNLMGTLGESLVPSLPWLQVLLLQGNRLVGSLPTSLAGLATQDDMSMQLYLGGNSFNYEGAQSRSLVQRCKDATFMCSGVPPMSCSAFGTGWMVRTQAPDECEKCGDMILSVVFILLGAVFAIAGVSAYVYAINKSTNLRKVISTIGIVLNHMQTVAIIGLLKMHWPESVTMTTSFFTIDFFDWGASRPECLANGVDMESFGGITVLFTAGHVALLLFLLHGIGGVQTLIKCVGSSRGWQPHKIERAVDRLEMVETIVFHVQLTAGLRLTAKLIDAMFIGGPFPIVGGVFGILLLVTQLLFIIKYYAAARMLALRLRGGGEMHGLHTSDGANADEGDAPTVEGANQRPVGGRGVHYQRSHVARRLPHFGARNKSKERLQRRMNYLVRRYGGHAWYWQFVLWTRQLLLTAVVIFPELAANLRLRGGVFSNASLPVEGTGGDASLLELVSNSTVLANSTLGTVPLLADIDTSMLQASLALLVFAIFYGLHRRIEPFIYAFQNMLDGALFLADMLIVGLGAIYTHVFAASGGSSTGAKAMEAVILVVLIGSVAGAIGYLWVRHMRAKRRKAARAKMARKNNEASDPRANASDPRANSDDDDDDRTCLRSGADDFGRFSRSHRSFGGARSGVLTVHLRREQTGGLRPPTTNVWGRLRAVAQLFGGRKGAPRARVGTGAPKEGRAPPSEGLKAAAAMEGIAMRGQHRHLPTSAYI